MTGFKPTVSIQTEQSLHPKTSNLTFSGEAAIRNGMVVGR